MAFHRDVQTMWTEMARYDPGEYRGPTLVIFANSLRREVRGARGLDPALLDSLAHAPRRHIVAFLESYGEALVSNARWEDALAIYAAAMRLLPNEEPACYSYGAVAVQLERYDEAIPALEAAIALRPDRVQSFNNLGIAKASLGDVEGAIEAFQRALQIDPTHERAAANLRLLENMRDRSPEAGGGVP